MDQPLFPDRWKVSDPELIAETFSSRIWKVRLGDGETAVVKDLKVFDDVYDELRGAHLLEWRRGEGLVRLLAMDGQRMLLEYAGDRLLTAEIAAQGDNTATLIAAETMVRLHAPSGHPAPLELQPLGERFVSLFRKAKADREAGALSIYVEAAETAERLLANQRDVRPLHGDLHHDNIMLGPRGWLAIDPKGLIGDPAFDAANMFYNGDDGHCLDPERVTFMAETFAKTLRQDIRAILDHALAHGCLSSAWHNEDRNEKDEARELAIAAVIRDVRLRS